MLVFIVVFVLTGIGCMSWSPLACGILTGKYDDGVPIYSRAALKVFLFTEINVSNNNHHSEWNIMNYSFI